MTAKRYHDHNIGMRPEVRGNFIVRTGELSELRRRYAVGRNLADLSRARSSRPARLCRQPCPLGMIVAKLSGRLRRAHARGAIRSVRMAIDLAALQMLQAVFGFDHWHARSPTSRRGYRDGVASLINEMHPLCVVEVGCGLGAILARVKAPERVGYDIDRGVVRAARCLHGRALTFREGGFEDVTQPAIDVLVALNWLHDFAPEQVATWLMLLLPRTRHVLVDRVEPTSPLSYRHHHDFAFLDGWAVATRIEEFGEEHRRFILYEVC